ASSILVLFNTILHEAGHHMSRKYGGGSALDNAPVPGGDNMDRNFEATPRYRTNPFVWWIKNEKIILHPTKEIF
ncbi:MAG: hypothetical protein ACK5QC_04670, partial [Bacteroidota bacterium]